MAMEEMTLRKGKFKGENGKRHEKCQSQQPVQMMEKSWVMTHQNDVEHEEYEEVCTTSEMWHSEKSVDPWIIDHIVHLNR